MSRRCVAWTLLLLLSASSQARPQVAFTGVVEPLEGTAACGEATHRLDCADVLLRSDRVDLDAFRGQPARFLAVVGPSPCNVMDVVAVEVPPPSHLAVCGTPVADCPLRLRSAPGRLAQHGLFVAASPAFLPLHPVKGTFFLGQPSVLLGVKFTSNFQQEGAAFDFVLPPDPSLFGLELFFQSVRRDILPLPIGGVGPMRFSNVVCVTISEGPAHCATLDC